MQQIPYPVQFSIDYPDRPLSRLTTFFRIFTAIPILILLTTLTGESSSSSNGHNTIIFAISTGSFLFLAPLLMILFRQKYPRWWFNWNLELLRFSNRISAYLTFMNDQYPSTDEEQSVHLDIPYPNAEYDLNRWLPLIKWLLAFPHYIVLAFLGLAVFFVLIFVWFAILFTQHYPRGLFHFVEGVFRWHNRVFAYAFLLATDQYPPFRLNP